MVPDSQAIVGVEPTEELLMTTGAEAVGLC